MTCLAVRSLLLLSSASYLACASEDTLASAQRAQIKDVSYYASIQKKDDAYGFDTATGAVIVHERFVLSNGYIVRFHIRDVSTYRVIFNRDDFLQLLEGAIDIEKAFFHPNMTFNGTTFANDIAVIKLTSKIDFNKYENVKPIKMANSSLVLKSGDQLMVMGFGQTNETLLPRYLQSVKVPYCDFEKCAKLMKKFRVTLTKTIICAGEEKQKGPCVFDFGDPLVYNDTLVGLSSMIALPCGGTYPSLYTNIASVRPFIDGVIKRELKIK